MKKKVLSLMLTAVLASSVLAGCSSAENAGNDQAGGKETDKNVEASKEASSEESAQEETVDLSALTFGEKGWKIDMSYDYSDPRFKRFDGLEFTRVVDTGGAELPAGMTVDNNDRGWLFELQTGMKTKTLWSATGQAYTDKLNATIASGEIPDLMQIKDINQYQMLVKSELLADLTDELLEGDHPMLQELYASGDNAALEMLKVDGRIYGIPQVYAQHDGSPLIWLRKDWMEELNLPEPKTYADLEDIALAFMEADFDGNGSDDTYGMACLAEYKGSYGGGGNLFNIFANVGGSAPGLWQKQEDGTVIYGSLMDGAKEALTLLNDWYQKGIIPADYATWNWDTMTQIVGEGKAGIVLAPWSSSFGEIGGVLGVDEKAQWKAYMLPGEEGAEVRSAAGNPILSIYVVNKDFEQPEAFVYAAEMIFNGYKAEEFSTLVVDTSNSYSPMMSSTYSANMTTGMKEPLDMIYETRAVTPEVEALVQKLTLGTSTGKEWTYAAAANYGVPVLDALEAGEDPRKVAAGELDAKDTYVQYLAIVEGMGTLSHTENLVGVTTAYQGQTDSMARYQTFLDEFEKTEYTKMIMGDIGSMSVADYFDNFVKEYLKQGGEQITKEVQEIIG